MFTFLPGLELAEIFYNDAVKPIIGSDFPTLQYSAALMGSGSEVLGYDTPLSMDHHWGPKLQIFLNSPDYHTHKDKLHETLRLQLPTQIKEIPTNFGPPDEVGVQHLVPIDHTPVNHLVYINNIDTYFKEKINIDPMKEISSQEWITIPEQKLLEVTKGKVFYDGLGKLNQLRSKLSFFPHDVWLYKMAMVWQKISDEEAFVGRCGEVEDDIGSRLITARIIENLMKLVFLIEKKYAPYSKWFGTGFSRLLAAEKLTPILTAALAADNWKERELNLSKAYEFVAKAHNKLMITPPLDTTVTKYHSRPYLVIHADRFAKKIKEQIKDKTLLK